MAGFGWDYPPGTPGPRRYDVDLRCTADGCPLDGAAIRGTVTEELGATYIDPEECPGCGASGPDLKIV